MYCIYCNYIIYHEIIRRFTLYSYTKPEHNLAIGVVRCLCNTRERYYPEVFIHVGSRGKVVFVRLSLLCNYCPCMLGNTTEKEDRSLGTILMNIVLPITQEKSEGREEENTKLPILRTR